MRRLFAPLLLLLLCPIQAEAVIAFVDKVAAQSTNDNDVTTGNMNSTGANLVTCLRVLYAGNDNGSAPTDNKLNTWNGLTAYELSAFSVRIKLYYCTVPCIVGAGHTFTLSAGASTKPALACASFSGVSTTPFDMENGGSAAFPAVALATGSVTTTGGLFIAGVGVPASAGGAFAIDSSFTITNQADATANAYGYGLAYKLGTGTENPQWTWPSGQNAAGDIGTFLTAAAGGAVNCLRSMRGFGC